LNDYNLFLDIPPKNLVEFFVKMWVVFAPSSILMAEIEFAQIIGWTLVHQ